MGRSNMASLKITLLPLAICLLLSLNSQVSGKPSPKHFLIETKEKAKKNNDYTGNVTNEGGKIGGIGDGSVNSGDYTGNVHNIGPCRPNCGIGGDCVRSSPGDRCCHCV